MVILCAGWLLYRLILGDGWYLPSRFMDGLPSNHTDFEKDHTTRWKLTTFWYWITCGRCGGGYSSIEVRNNWVARVLPWVMEELANPLKMDTTPIGEVTNRESLKRNIKGNEKRRDWDNYNLLARVVRWMSRGTSFAPAYASHDKMHVQMLSSDDGNRFARIKFMGSGARDECFISVVANQEQYSKDGTKRDVCCRSGTLAGKLSDRNWILLLDCDRGVATPKN